MYRPNLVNYSLKKVKNDPINHLYSQTVSQAIPMNNYIVAKVHEFNIIESFQEVVSKFVMKIFDFFKWLYYYIKNFINGPYFINLICFIFLVFFVVFFYKISTELHKQEKELYQIKSDSEIRSNFNNSFDPILPYDFFKK